MCSARACQEKRTIHANVSIWKCESNFRKITDDCNISDREWLILGKRIVCASSVPHRRWLEGKNLEKITESFKDGHKTFKVAASADWTEIIAAVVKMTRLTLHGPLLYVAKMLITLDLSKLLPPYLKNGTRHIFPFIHTWTKIGHFGRWSVALGLCLNRLWPNYWSHEVRQCTQWKIRIVWISFHCYLKWSIVHVL